MTERFMVDDAGTLIDMQTRDMFDIVEEVCPLLNRLHEENQQIKQQLEDCKTYNGIIYANATANDRKLLKQIQQIKHLIDVAIETERTELGKSTLRQLRDRIQ